jgi:hypothetical protein
MSDEKQNTAAVQGKIIARAWRDPAFKAKLIADPKAVLQEAGVTLPPNITVEVLENTDTHVHFVLPPKPREALSDEALDKVAGAVGDCNPITRSGAPSKPF